MIALLVTTFVASLAGSLHCAGMCGGFVAFYSSAQGTQLLQRRRWGAHLAYNGARLLTYGTLGAVAGALGAAVDLAGATAVHLERTAAIIAGGVMILWGTATLLPALGVHIKPRRISDRLGRLYGRACAHLKGRPPLIRALLLGASTALLPCGWLYVFVVAAASTGTAAAGAAVMASFWLGSVPIMLGLGAGVQLLSRALGRHLPALTAIAVMALGVVALTGRLAMPRPGIDASSTPAPAATHAPVLVNSEPPCPHHQDLPPEIPHK